MSDPAVPCEYSQAQYDDFQWEQVRIHPGTRAPADLPHGEPTLSHHSSFVSFQGQAACPLAVLPWADCVTSLGLICPVVTHMTVNVELSGLRPVVYIGQSYLHSGRRFSRPQRPL